MALGTVMVSGLQVEDVIFPGSVKPPGSTNTLFLGGAGVRKREIQGQVFKDTAIGIYLAQDAVSCLEAKWKGKTIDELTSSLDFFTDIIWGEFEKCIRVTMIRPFMGEMYAEKVSENCVAYWKAIGTYTDVEANAVEEFKDAFKDVNLSPGASVLFTLSPLGSLTIAFSKVRDGPIPEVGSRVIEKKKQVGEVVLQTIIGKDGVSPTAKRSLADRIHGLLLQFEDAANVDVDVDVDVDANANVNAVSEDKIEVAKQENGDSIHLQQGGETNANANVNVMTEDKVEVTKQGNGDSIHVQQAGET